MSEELHIKAIIDSVDDSKLQQSLAKTQSNTSKALSGGGSNQQTAISRAVADSDKLGQKMKLLQDVQEKLSNQPGMSRELAKVNQQMAGVYGSFKNLSKDQNSFISNLQKEVELRKQSTQLITEANKAQGVYSAHSQRQFEMLQQITRSAPGGGIINQFMSGASQAAASAGGGGEGASLMSGLAGGGLAAAAGVAAAGIAALTSKVSELAGRSTQLAQYSNNPNSPLGQLRSATEQNKISMDIAASSPGSVGIAKAMQNLGKEWNDLVGHAFSSDSERNGAIQDRLKAGLGGSAQLDWKKILEQRSDMEQDIGLARKNLDTQIFRQDRDYELDLRKTKVDTQNQIFDLTRSQQRQQQDFQINLAQFQENFSGQMAAKQFQQSQQFAQASFQRQQGYAISDYNRGRSDKLQDFSVTANDKAFDLSRSLSRNQEQFNLNKSYQGQDRQENLMRMAISGASGTDYLFSSMDFRKQQAREQQQFDLAKRYQVEDYSTGQGRDLRNLNIGLGRDQRNLNIGLARNATEFGASQQEALVGRQNQIETETNARKWQGIQIGLQYSRMVQDINTSWQRLGQSISFQQEGLANRASDMQYDQGMAKYQLNLDAYRAQRGQNYTEMGFAAQMRDTDPLGALGQSLKDQTFGKALAQAAAATGQRPLWDEYSDYIKSTLKGGPGAIAGDAIRAGAMGVGAGSIGLASNFKDNGQFGSGGGSFAAGGNSDWGGGGGSRNYDFAGTGAGGSFGAGGPSDWGSSALASLPYWATNLQQKQQRSQPMQVTFNAGNASFPALPGVSQSDLSALDTKWQDIQARGQNEMMDFMRRLYGG